MSELLSAYRPAPLFRFFEELSAIPRPSGHEERVADYLVAFAEARGLEVYRDAVHNVLIKKPAAPGYEALDAVLLQGHTDMVCEKNSGVEHDFFRDPLKLRLDGDMLSAEGTTLGGDDGAAVALMLCALDDKTLPAPALECLFTTSEETGLGGADCFDYSRIRATALINLDSEEEGIAWVGSAGAENTVLSLCCDRIPLQNSCVRVSLSGLAGGHSGTDIDHNRYNANLLLARLLRAVYVQTPFNLVSIAGGKMRNAIPREAEAVLASTDRERLCADLKAAAAKVRAELSPEDQGMRLHADKCGAPADTMLTFRSTSRLLSLMLSAPAGVQSMSVHMPGLVESSTNLGTVVMTDGSVELGYMSRSSSEGKMDLLEQKFDALAALAGEDVSCTHTGRYSGWEFIPDTPLQNRYKAVYTRLFPGKEPVIASVHAGLECSTICEKTREAGGAELDAISIGPDIFDIHSPDERMDCRSLERLWQLLAAMLAEK